VLVAIARNCKITIALHCNKTQLLRTRPLLKLIRANAHKLSCAKGSSGRPRRSPRRRCMERRRVSDGGANTLTSASATSPPSSSAPATLSSLRAYMPAARVRTWRACQQATRVSY
jgi:hypothetical protein